MREIKFKVWDLDKKEMLRVNQLYFPAHPDQGEKMGIYAGGWVRNGKLLEYTGFTDKRGVEIYEGNIIKWTESHNRKVISEVKWIDDLAGFKPFISIDGDCEDYFDVHPCEVIGHIYLNPELFDSSESQKDLL